MCDAAAAKSANEAERGLGRSSLLRMGPSPMGPTKSPVCWTSLRPSGPARLKRRAPSWRSRRNGSPRKSRSWPARRPFRSAEEVMSPTESVIFSARNGELGKPATSLRAVAEKRLGVPGCLFTTALPIQQHRCSGPRSDKAALVNRWELAGNAARVRFGGGLSSRTALRHGCQRNQR